MNNFGIPEVLGVRIGSQASYQYLLLDWKECGYFLKGIVSSII